MDQASAAATIKAIFEEVIDGGRYEHIDRYFTSDYVEHNVMGDLQGTEAFTGMLEGFRLALPGFRHHITDVTMIGESTALWQIQVTASFTGDFMGTRGQGQHVDFWVANAARFADDGRIAEHWSLGGDAFAVMLTQMGIDPAVLAPTG